MLEQENSSKFLGRNEMDQKTERVKETEKGCFSKSLIVLSVIFGCLFYFYELPDFIRDINAERINKKFTIRYMESHRSKCIFNGNQIFVSDVEAAYWNNDSLLVSDRERCYLITLNIKTYREDREEISCGNLHNMLWQQPIKVWTEDRGVELLR